MFLALSCSWLWPIHWSQTLSREWRCICSSAVKLLKPCIRGLGNYLKHQQNNTQWMNLGVVKAIITIIVLQPDRYKAIQCNTIFQIALQWAKHYINKNCHPKDTPHFPTYLASYRLAIVRISRKIYCISTTLHYISKYNMIVRIIASLYKQCNCTNIFVGVCACVCVCVCVCGGGGGGGGGCIDLYSLNL